MFTKNEALTLWDDLIENHIQSNGNEAFLSGFGEVIYRRNRTPYLSNTEQGWGYFVEARQFIFNKNMCDAFSRICEKHQCSYRIDMGDDNNPRIIFYKDKEQRNY